MFGVVMLTQAIKSTLLSLLFIAVFALSNVASAVPASFTEQICLLNLELDTKPTNKSQTLNFDDNIHMQLTNTVAIKEMKSARIASNITCQQLTGASYTGSDAEWAKFFDSAFQGMLKANFKDIQFTLVGEEDKSFHSTFANDFVVKEYIFTADAGGNKQIIKNLALLDKANNSVYTFSVSGNEIVEAEISEEFTRLVASIKKAAK